MARLAVLALVVATACFSKPPRPGESLCGDGELQDTEQCDDGNLDDLDGCSVACTIEPWFVCPDPGVHCHPVTELQWTEPGTALDGVGGQGGQDFDDNCATVVGLSGRRSVIVGFAGGADGNNEALTELNAVCADIALEADGGIHWESPRPLPVHGGAATGRVTRVCAEDEIATGFVGSADAVVGGFQLTCQALTHRGGTLAFGTPNHLVAVGPDNLTAQPPQTCGPFEVARDVIGKSGGVVDRFSLRCVPTTQVICGDGLVTFPETCDDGNAEPGDGCNARCDGD